MPRRLVPVLLAATVIVVGGANLAAYAANGKPVLLGHGTKASKSTTIKSSKGVPLKLKSKPGTPALSVSNSQKVAGLNADLVDGLDSAALENQSFVYTLTGTSATNKVSFPLTGLPAGKYLVDYVASAEIGGAPTYFTCYVSTAFGGTAYVSESSPAGAIGFASASGYLDVSTGSYSVFCTTDGTSLGMPTSPEYPSQVVLTRLDDVTVRSQTGSAP
jgi:hypothetical protein